MLPKINRLRSQKDIERVAKGSRSFREGFLALKTIANNLGQSRFGFVVSLKVSKKSHVRQKIKRRMRESVRPYLGKFAIGYDGLFIALPGLETKSFKDIKQGVDSLMKKSGLSKNKR